MSIVEETSNLATYIASQLSLQIYLDVKEPLIDQMEQLSQQIYKVYFLNSNKKILLHTFQKVDNQDFSTLNSKIEKTYLITRQLSQANFPILKPLFICNNEVIIGVPFYATEFIEGRIFKDLRKFNDDDKYIILQEIIKNLAMLHSISQEFWGVQGQCKDQWNVFNKKLYNQYKLNETQINTNVEDLLYWVSLNQPQEYEGNQLSLIHGDFSFSKLIFHPTKLQLLAILDWQNASIGRPFQDLTQFLLENFITLINKQYYFDGSVGIENIFSIPEINQILTLYYQQRSIEDNQSIKYYMIQQLMFKSITYQTLYHQTKDTQYLSNSKFLSKIGYNVILEITQNDPYGIKDRAQQDTALWSNWPVSQRCKSYYYRIKDFMKEEIFPIEKDILDKARKDPQGLSNPPIPEIEQLQLKAKEQGLWNLFISDPKYGKGLTNLEYVFLSELMGLSYLAHEIFNCFAPETGNIKLLISHGTPYLKEKYLQPLLEGECKSFFAMTEKNIASSDPSNFKLTITPVENGYVLNGIKQFVSGAPDQRSTFGIVMGKTSKNGQSMIIVDMPNPGIKIVRQLPFFGFYDLPHSLGEMVFQNAFIPKENVLGKIDEAFKMAQGRLLGGRLHHCVRQVGLTRRCLDLALQRANERTIYGESLSKNSAFQQKIGKLEMLFQCCRIMCLNVGLLMDSAGSKNINTFMAVSQCKAYIPKTSQKIIDECIQVFGAEGVTEDQPLFMHWRMARNIRFMDGPCEVHLRQIAKFAFGNTLMNDLNNAQGYGIARL